MTLVKLMTIEKSFLLKGAGLTLLPDFRVPERWRNCTAGVVVRLSDGTTVHSLAQFRVAHFRIESSTAKTQPDRWRIVISLPGTSKDLVPDGSDVLVSLDVLKAVHGDIVGN